jgi:hypothetical protein
MKNQERPPEFKVAAYEFFLTPRTFAIPKGVAGCFALELDKGTSSGRQDHKLSNVSMSRSFPRDKQIFMNSLENSPER